MRAIVDLIWEQVKYIGPNNGEICVYFQRKADSRVGKYAIGDK